MNSIRIAVDTNVVIAALVSWHEHHTIARDELNQAFERGEIVLAQHVVLEAYSVLTRLPAPHRLAPDTAFQLLEQTFKEDAAIIGFPASKTWRFLSNSVSDHVAGGRIYDAHILASAVHGKADELLTFNARHFEPAPKGLIVRALTSR